MYLYNAVTHKQGKACHAIEITDLIPQGPYHGVVGDQRGR